MQFHDVSVGEARIVSTSKPGSVKAWKTGRSGVRRVPSKLRRIEEKEGETTSRLMDSLAKPKLATSSASEEAGLPAEARSEGVVRIRT